MEKVFKALGIIIETLSDDKGRVMCRKELDVLIQALQRLDSIENANHSEALECLEQLAEMADKCWVSCDVHKWKNTIKQALLKAQEQENENARLKEILINGFRDKNGVFHKQTYLAFIDDEWCICDLKTDEWFLVKEVL